MVDVDKWTLDELVDACTLHLNKKIIEIPRFQRKRAKEWENIRESLLIDSIKKKYPIGSITLYKIPLEKIDKYILLDGLQRTITILNYYNNPLNFDINKEIINKITKELISRYKNQAEEIKQICKKWFALDFLGNYNNMIKWSHRKKNKELEKLCLDYKIKKSSVVNDIIDQTDELIEYIRISDIKIPIMICNCDESELFQIFERLNTTGVKLQEHEIYAATWNNEQHVNIESEDIIEGINEYYSELKKNNLGLNIYDNDNGQRDKYNLYEYLFGLKGVIDKKYNSIKKNYDMIFIFKVCGCCLNKNINLKKIPEKLLELFKENKINDFEKKIFDSIEFTLEAIKFLTIKTKDFIPKYYKMPDINVFACIMGSYYNNSEIINKNKKCYLDIIAIHYLYDKLIHRWKSSSNVTIERILNDDIYIKKIPLSEFRNNFEVYTNKCLEKNVKITNDKDKIILSLIKNKTFNISDDSKLDIEHIISKEILINYQKKFNIEFPITCLGNLCYLDKNFNRSKKEKLLDNGSNLSHEEIVTKYTYIPFKKIQKIYLDIKNDKDNMLPVYKEYCKERNKKILDLIIAYYEKSFDNDIKNKQMINNLNFNDTKSNNDEIKDESEKNDDGIVESNVIKKIKKSRMLLVKGQYSRGNIVNADSNKSHSRINLANKDNKKMNDFEEIDTDNDEYNLTDNVSYNVNNVLNDKVSNNIKETLDADIDDNNISQDNNIIEPPKPTTKKVVTKGGRKSPRL